MLNQNNMNEFDINAFFEHLVGKVLDTQTFGIGRKRIQLNWVACSSKEKADRFTFAIPYAGQSLQWTVLFNSSCPEMGPDFEFHDDLFLADPDINTIEEDIPSLANWQAANPESLLKVLSELVVLYKRHQIRILQQNEERLYAEYRQLTECSDFTIHDVEIMLPLEMDAPNEAKFMIRLEVNASKLPRRKIKGSNDTAMLVITYHPPKWSRIVPILHLSTSLEETFTEFGYGPLSLPPLTKDHSLKHYVNEVRRYLLNVIDTIVNSYEKRKNFVATMLFLQRRNIIEYDATDFSKITILLEHQDFYFLVNFFLPPTFPERPPIVRITSIYHMGDTDELIGIAVNDFRYNPTWNASRIISEILERIITNDALRLRSITMNVNKK